MDFECQKWIAQIGFFDDFQRCLYGAIPGVKFSVRGPVGSNLMSKLRDILGYFGALGLPNGAKILTKSIKNLIIFWIEFWMRFCPKMVSKMFPKIIQSLSKIHSRPNLV